MDRDEIINLYKCPAIDASYQVSVHLVKRFRNKRFFRNRSIRNKNCLWRPCLLLNWDGMSNYYTGLSKDVPYQVSINLARQFPRKKRFVEINKLGTRLACGDHVC